MAKFSEKQVHEHLYKTGLEALIQDSVELDQSPAEPDCDEDGEGFQLWRIIKDRALGRLRRLHQSVRYGEFIGSNLELPTDHTRPMELDLLGVHEDGLFVLELKVERSAERNAFSELFAYSNYIAGMFALSGPQDIANILVANLDNKITGQAFLYDLLISERDIIVYRPVFPTGELSSMQLEIHIPSDGDFRHFTNQLLSHDAMGCVVISFDDLPGWFDSEEEDGSLNDWTRKNLAGLSGYTAQLMEAERLHGFCFIRKPWKEIPRYYRNSLFICALNPFNLAEPTRTSAFLEKIDERHRSNFLEYPQLGFDGRLIRIAQRALKDCLTHNYRGEVETPYWGGIVESSQEVVFTHNFAFRPTGMMREAYVGYLNRIYACKAVGKDLGEDVSVVKIEEINNWMRAWTFMESCGFHSGHAADG
ncbi:hypothetical protein NKH85_12610 [Mesorhizobium sp. M0924]|uniref:hypothetical protein n=1 Tax=unclassified Mesorhizobium TaxID=325217 RepID=UPI00333A27C5